MAKLYSIEATWPGETCAILTCGPSTADHDLTVLSAVRVIAINDAWRIYPQADVLFSGDWRFFRDNPDLSGFQGSLIGCVSAEAFPKITDPRKVLLGRGPRKGISQDRYKVAGQYTCVGQAVSFAYHRGCRRIVLIGVDLRPSPEGLRYAFSEQVADTETLATYSQMRRNLDSLGIYAGMLGVSLRLAGLRSTLKRIQKFRTLEEALFKC